MIHGHKRKTAKNARKESSRPPLDKVLGNQPPDRIAGLERQIAELQKDVAMLKQLSGWPLFADEGYDELQEGKKPGPKEKISDGVLFHYRDGLVLWLEPYWSWLEESLRKARTSEQERSIFEAVAEEPELRPEWQKRLLQNAAALHEFLSGERFRKRPLPNATMIDALNLDVENETRQRAANQFPSRQIANAMAGVPEISWRTSLDRCSAQPSTDFVTVNLDMFYRNTYGISMPKDRDFAGASSPMPKPLRTVLARSSDGTNNHLKPK